MCIDVVMWGFIQEAILSGGESSGACHQVHHEEVPQHRHQGETTPTCMNLLASFGGVEVKQMQ